ncbi:MAG: sugar phosphate isomerase/epimerase [Acidobacteria bacterium]|nr:sugar phosphate isomerase/epimerase [Acidobacteriota bacterium]
MALASRWTRLISDAFGGSLRFKYAICNEMFEQREFAAQCRAIRAAGFQGIEIAPFTLGDHLDGISAARRRELRMIIEGEGIQFAGLHWLLITPKWLHLTTADREIRCKSWEYFLKLIDFCADLGKGVMVLGSPAQRASKGNTAADAVLHLKEGLAKVAPHARERGCKILIEALPSKDTNVVNTLAQAVQIVKELKTPAVQTMFDFHNTPDEKDPMDLLVRRYFRYIRHVHINEMDGRHPGTGGLDFLPVFKVLAELKYRGWVSLEVFDFKPGPENILRDTMAYIRSLETRLGA